MPEPEEPKSEPAAPKSFEDAAERAQTLFEELRQAQSDYDRQFGNSQYPERYCGYAEQTERLQALTAEFESVLDYMLEHYKEMDAEPMFQISGTPGDISVYRQQAEDALSKLADYMALGAGLADPDYVLQQLTFAARMQRTLEQAEQEQQRRDAETIPFEKKVLEQAFLGEDSKYQTVEGAVLRGGLGFIPGIDTVMDIQDLDYDIRNWKDVSAGQKALDIFAALPLAGIVGDALVLGKNVGKAADAVKALNRAGEAIDAGADTLKGAARTGELVEAGLDTAKTADRLGGTAEAVTEGMTAAQRAGYEAGRKAAALAEGGQSAEAGIDMTRAGNRMTDAAKLERRGHLLYDAIANQTEDGIISNNSLAGLHVSLRVIYWMVSSSYTALDVKSIFSVLHFV